MMYLFLKPRFNLESGLAPIMGLVLVSQISFSGNYRLDDILKISGLLEILLIFSIFIPIISPCICTVFNFVTNNY